MGAADQARRCKERQGGRTSPRPKAGIPARAARREFPSPRGGNPARAGIRMPLSGLAGGRRGR